MLPTFGHLELRAIQPEDLPVGADEYAPDTVRKAYQRLAHALAVAVEDGRMARTPCRRITLPKLSQEEKRFLSAEEVNQLAEAIHPRYRA